MCPRVPDREPPQERPQTPRPEPTADTDPLESEPVLDYAQATQSRAVASSESSSDVFEDAFECFPVEPESSRAQASSRAVVSAENNPSSSPTDAPEQQNNLTDAPEQQNNPTDASEQQNNPTDASEQQNNPTDAPEQQNNPTGN